MTPEELMKRSADLGAKLARRVFARRGNHSEVHLSEDELAGLLGLAAELAFKETLPAAEQAKLPQVVVEPAAPKLHRVQGGAECCLCGEAGVVYTVEGLAGYIEACAKHREQVAIANLKEHATPEPDEPAECSACGGMLIPLGALGNRTHYRCRACGLESSRVD